tara:strand:+ start:96729 stop:96944 length:216 start_codon:yes stop_codon:yes gene_type:complete
MLLEIINKILLILLVMSALNILRHVYYFIQAWVKSTTEAPQKYFLNRNSLYMLGVSIGYVMMAIIDGILIK